MDPMQDEQERRRQVQQFLMQRFQADPQGQSVEAAEEEARKQKLTASLGRAGSTIGAAISGTEADTGFYDRMMSGADQTVDQARDRQNANRKRKLMLAQHLQSKFRADDQKDYERRQDKMTNERANEKLELARRAQRLDELEAAQGAGQPAGDAPPGYRYKPDGSLEPIPGGPAARDIAEKKKKAEKRHETKATAANTVVQDIGRGLELMKESSFDAGPVMGHLQHVPGSPANRLSKFIESAKSNIGIDQLQQMRESSPTGGALGQVPFRQQQRLEQLLGSLDLTQPEPVLEANMKRVANEYLDVIHGKGNGPERFELPFDKMGRSKDETQGSGTAYAGEDGGKAAPGRKVKVDGKIYRVAEDGDTLIPIENEGGQSGSW